ncbi:MAG: nickel-binding protein [Steroidobacteraceae bacterium]
MLQTWFIRRTGIAAGAADLNAVLTRLRSFEEREHAMQARWLHSYALRESDGRFGLACLFQADQVSTLQRHAGLLALPADEILPVEATRVRRAFAPSLVYLVRRRGLCRCEDDFTRCAEIARRIGEEEMPSKLSWLHSYIVREHDGLLGSVCLYQGVDARALREHAERAGLSADEITPVLGRIIFRATPTHVHADPSQVVPA